MMQTFGSINEWYQSHAHIISLTLSHTFSLSLTILQDILHQFYSISEATGFIRDTHASISVSLLLTRYIFFLNDDEWWSRLYHVVWMPKMTWWMFSILLLLFKYPQVKIFICKTLCIWSQNKNFIFIHASDDFNAHLYSISIKIKTIICRIGKCLDMRHHVMSRFIMEKYVSCLRRQIMLYSKSLPNLDVPQDHQRYRYRQAIRVLSRCGPSALCVFFFVV